MYHPELTQVVGFVLAFSFAVYLVGCFFYGYTNQDIEPIKFTDKFTLGYVEDDQGLVYLEDSQPHIPVKVSVADTSKKELISKLEDQLKSMQYKISKMEKQTAKKPKPKLEDSQLFNDCVTTLMNLGYKGKRVAKKDVADFLANNDISSAEQFIAEFFKKVKKN